MYELEIIAEPDSGNGLDAGRFDNPLPSPIKALADTVYPDAVTLPVIVTVSDAAFPKTVLPLAVSIPYVVKLSQCVILPYIV